MRFIEIARANADMAVDQTEAYKDSVSAFAQNVRDSLREEGLEQLTRQALAVYYTRVGELLSN